MAVVGDRESRHGIVLAKMKSEALRRLDRRSNMAGKSQVSGSCDTPAHHEKYVFYSGRLRAMYGEYTDRVEPFGLDECWLDMTGIVSDYDEAEALASTIRRRVRMSSG